MTPQHWTIPGAHGEPIYGTTHLPPDHGDRPPTGCILICHGFKGYKDYGFFPALAQHAAQRGLIAHRFNFSHSGVTDHPATFARLDLFEINTWSKMITDLFAVSDAAAAGKLPPGPHPLPIVWFGHSRGGVAVILAAAQRLGQDPTNPHPSAVIAAAAPYSPYGFSEDQLQRLRQHGQIESPSSRTGQTLHVNKIWLDEIESNPAAHDPLDAIAKITRPIMILHGDTDQTVHADAAHLLHRATEDRARLHILPGATHTFNAPNPMPLDAPVPAPTAQFIQLTCDFALRACTEPT